MNKICVMGVYFGILPKYFDLWLKSCELNSTIDFIVFTDQKVERVPQNVKIEEMTLQRMKQLAISNLCLEVSLERPYKCCDFKVVYGIIFKEYIESYDYWGHCDFDVIFGDLQCFFDRFNLYSYDKFLTLGHLTLYRNTPEVNLRYKCEGSKYSYRDVFANDNSYAFDEVCGINAIYRENAFSMFDKLIFIDVASIWKRYKLYEGYIYDISPKNYKYQVFYWEDGKIYRAFYKKGKIKTEEYCYIHFKKRENFDVTFDITSENAFYITNKGFIPKRGEVTIGDIKQFNGYKGWAYEKAEYVEFVLGKMCKRIKNKILR